MFVVNLGGEGEVAGALNQQPPWFVTASGAVNQQHFLGLVAAGENYLICPNEALALPDECADVVHTNNVPLDVVTWREPGVQTSEIWRILKSGGQWIDNGQSQWTKP